MEMRVDDCNCGFVSVDVYYVVIKDTIFMRFIYTSCYLYEVCKCENELLYQNYLS